MEQQAKRVMRICKQSKGPNGVFTNLPASNGALPHHTVRRGHEWVGFGNAATQLTVLGRGRWPLRAACG